MKWIIAWCVFLVVDTGFLLAADPHITHSSKAYFLPGGGIVAYFKKGDCQ